jgi:hypothetical protein
MRKMSSGGKKEGDEDLDECEEIIPDENDMVGSGDDDREIDEEQDDKAR